MGKNKKCSSTLTKNSLGKIVHETKTEWMTIEIIQLIQERRKYKNKNHEAYKECNQQIRRKVRAAKIDWLNEQCKEMERLQAVHDDFNIHKLLKQTCGVYKNKKFTPLLLNDQNEVIDSKKRIKLWEDYVRTVFSSNRPPLNESENENELTGCNITLEEVVQAVKSSKDNKSPGPDEIPADILKLIDENNLQLLQKTFNYIYDTGRYPQDWLKSTFITLPKKASAKKCDEYRLISLMSHSLKVFLKIIHNRIYKKCEEAMGSSQFGFKNGMGTREALFALNVLVQNCKDVQKDVFICFLDYEKAFDNVQHDKLFEILETIGIDEKELRCLKNLYWNQTAQVRLSDENTKDIRIHKGVRQGCVLSPLLFNIYAEKIFQEALWNTREGIKVNGVIINNIRYADDTILLTDSISDMQKLLNKVVNSSQQFGLKINIKKTKFMHVSRKPTITQCALTIYDESIEKVPSYKYLGCWVNESWDASAEIRTRIEMARSTFCKFKKIFSCHDFNIKHKIRFIKCYVWSVLLYGVECWTIKVADMNRLEAFEMWAFRRILKIPWTEHVSNMEVLRRIKHGRELLQTIKRRKTAYLGHTLRNSKYHFLQLILEGKIEGKRGVGRKQLSWLRNIRNWTGLGNIAELWNAAKNRDTYREIVNNIN